MQIASWYAANLQHIQNIRKRAMVASGQHGAVKHEQCYTMTAITQQTQNAEVKAVAKWVSLMVMAMFCR